MSGHLMKTSLAAITLCFLAAPGAFAGQPLSDPEMMFAQSGRPGGPPPEAIEACASASQSSSCSFSAPDGTTVSGTCSAPPQGGSGDLACVPSRNRG